MYQPRHWRVRILIQRIRHHRVKWRKLPSLWNHLVAHWAIGIAPLKEAGEVGGDVYAKNALRHRAFALFVGQIDDLSQLIDGVEAVGHLPLPTVPLLVGNIRE